MTIFELGTGLSPFFHIPNELAAMALAQRGVRPDKPPPFRGLDSPVFEVLWTLMVTMWAHEAHLRPSSQVIYVTLEACFGFSEQPASGANSSLVVVLPLSSSPSSPLSPLPHSSRRSSSPAGVAQLKPDNQSQQPHSNIISNPIPISQKRTCYDSLNPIPTPIPFTLSSNLPNSSLAVYQFRDVTTTTGTGAGSGSAEPALAPIRRDRDRDRDRRNTILSPRVPILSSHSHSKSENSPPRLRSRREYAYGTRSNSSSSGGGGGGGGNIERISRLSISGSPRVGRGGRDENDDFAWGLR